MTRQEVMTKLKEYGEDISELEDLVLSDLIDRLEDLEDTSDMHPNETYEEFMEHEDW